jgi:hypothetical protein
MDKDYGLIIIRNHFAAALSIRNYQEMRDIFTINQKSLVICILEKIFSHE